MFPSFRAVMMGPISSVSSPGSSTYVFSLPAIFARDFTSSQADEQKCVKHNQQLVTGHHHHESHYEESQSNVSGCARDALPRLQSGSKEGHLFLPLKERNPVPKKLFKCPHVRPAGRENAPPPGPFFTV